MFWLNLLRSFLSIFVVKPLTLVFPKIKERWEFEERNWSFQKKFDGPADFCFEVSSEGELEQVRPLIEHFLSNQKKVEVLYCSASVEKNIKVLIQKYPQQIHVLRVPLLHYRLGSPSQFNIHKWITASHLILCRYDFFPEFLEWAKGANRKLGLLSATALNLEKKFKQPILGFYNRKYWSRFDWIIPATREDEEILKKLFPNKILEAFDFRFLGVAKRQELANTTLEVKFPQFTSFRFLLQNYKLEKRSILGSAWIQDLAIFDNVALRKAIRDGEFFLAIAPHDIGPEMAQHLAMKYPDLPLYEWEAMMTEANAKDLVASFVQKPGIILINLKGVLCELYTLFSQVLVGGGFSKSVHSVLEPFVANCTVSTGPFIQRSTEVRFVKAFDSKRLHVLETATQWITVLDEGQLNDQKKMTKLMAEFRNAEVSLLQKMENLNA